MAKVQFHLNSFKNKHPIGNYKFWFKSSQILQKSERTQKKIMRSARFLLIYRFKYKKKRHESQSLLEKYLNLPMFFIKILKHSHDHSLIIVC